MKVPNWFRIVWWTAVVIGLGAYLFRRYPMLVAGQSSPVDVVAFLVWVALCLVPLFQEVGFLGFRFKQAMDDLKNQLGEQMNSLKSDIRNSIEVSSQISPQFYLSPPPSDSQLPALEEKIRKMVGEEFQRRGVHPPPAPNPLESVDSDVSLMFSARYQIERELRRLASELESVGQPGYPIPRLTGMLVDSGILDPQLASAIRDVYRICSPAIHGQLFTRGQRDFVRETAPSLIAALRNIKKQD